MMRACIILYVHFLHPNRPAFFPVVSAMCNLSTSTLTKHYHSNAKLPHVYVYLYLLEKKVMTFFDSIFIIPYPGMNQNDNPND